MELFFQILKVYGASLIGYGFIYFVALRLFNNSNHKKNAIFSLIVGISLLLITLGFYVFDSIRFNVIWHYSFKEPYYVFLNTCILLNIIIPVTFLILSKSRKQKFVRAEKVIKVTPTIKDVNEAVYYVFTHNNNFLLREIIIDNKDYYSGNFVKLGGETSFHDVMISKIIDSMNIKEYSQNIEISKLVGEVKVKGKGKDMHYYCYTIDVDEIPEKLKNFKEISPFDLVNYNLSDFDKQILYHIILKDYFKIEM